MARRELPEINAGSMADIAFLLLIFFLVTTTMDTDGGLTRKLPPMPEEQLEDLPEVKQRNVFEVLVNANDQLLVEGELLLVSDLISSCGTSKSTKTSTSSVILEETPPSPKATI